MTRGRLNRYKSQQLVRSSSRPNEYYKVSETWGGRYECSCKGWTLHKADPDTHLRKDCKHIRALKAQRGHVPTPRPIIAQATRAGVAYARHAATAPITRSDAGKKAGTARERRAQVTLGR